MNEFLSWCRHLLAPFIFHEVKSYFPLFQRDEYSYIYIGRSNAISAMYCSQFLTPVWTSSVEFAAMLCLIPPFPKHFQYVHYEVTQAKLDRVMLLHGYAVAFSIQAFHSFHTTTLEHKKLPPTLP